MTALPDFASNYSPSENIRVADKVNELFRLLRENKVTPPPIAIATAYINPAGFALLADELHQAPQVRLLLGAEPDQESVRAVSAEDADRDARLDAALQRHDGWLAAERDLMGFERVPFEQARQMVEWLRSTDAAGNSRVEVRRLSGAFLHGKAYLVQDAATPAALAGSSNMTYAGLALNAELNLGTGGGTSSASKVTEWFEHFWANADPYDLAELYGRLWEPHTPWSIYLRMLWELYAEHLEEDENELPRTGLGLTRFQADGVVRMQRLLDEYGGVLVADEVGLGKTFLAGEVIFQTANVNRQRVLVVAPAALKSSMWEPFLETHDFSRWVKVYSYEEVRNKLDPDHPEYRTFIREIEDYSLVVVDEAHNLRNAGAQRSGAVDRVITAGKLPKRVVLLTATPVNNSLTDLETLVRYFIRDDARFASLGIPSIKQYIKDAQAVDPSNLTPEHLFDLMDQVAVRRTRRFVKEHYTNDSITGPDGKLLTITFPQPKVRRIDYPLSDLDLQLIDAVVYALDDPTDPHSMRGWQDRVVDPKRLMLARYLSGAYAIGHDLESYEISNAGLLRSGLLKRLESSPQALHTTLTKMIASHEAFLVALEQGWVLRGDALSEWVAAESDDLDGFLADFDDRDQAARADGFQVKALATDVTTDLVLLRELADLAVKVIGAGEPKAQRLIEELTQIAADARRVDARGVPAGDRRKVLIFSTFTDTVVPVHGAVVAAVNAAPDSSPLADYRGRIAPPIMGAYAKVHERGASGGVDQGGRASTIAGFAPLTAGPRSAAGAPTASDDFDLLFTTDVLAEGVNLQQAGQMINYDLPWNPMKIVQRHGRIDRIGSVHDVVHLGLFFPSERLESLLALEARLEAKLALANAAVGHVEVLPGRKGAEVNLTDESVEQEFEALLAAGGSSASLSGEELRRRLYEAFHTDRVLRGDVTSLPYGSGSGFTNADARGNGYVFCMRIGSSSKPWFRYVYANDDWSVKVNEDGLPQVDSETLTSLRVADPASEDADRWLPTEIYDRAFEAWRVARDAAFADWSALTDPNAFQPDQPASFRDAHDLVVNRGGYLGTAAQRELAGRLRAVPTHKVALQVRRALNDGRTNEERVERVREVLDDAGIVAPPPHEPLPEVAEHEVRLVAWMAVRGTA